MQAISSLKTVAVNDQNNPARDAFSGSGNITHAKTQRRKAAIARCEPLHAQTTFAALRLGVRPLVERPCDSLAQSGLLNHQKLCVSASRRFTWSDFSAQAAHDQPGGKHPVVPLLTQRRKAREAAMGRSDALHAETIPLRALRLGVRPLVERPCANLAQSGLLNHRKLRVSAVHVVRFYRTDSGRPARD